MSAPDTADFDVDDGRPLARPSRTDAGANLSPAELLAILRAQVFEARFARVRKEIGR